jgi:predicted NUDIX family NTP pyrophosphohydrolase
VFGVFRNPDCLRIIFISAQPGVPQSLPFYASGAGCRIEYKIEPAGHRLQSTEVTTVPKQSAGLLLFRRRNSSPQKSGLEVFLVHPGGPFWAKKDLGAWSVPKGEYRGDEAPLAAALREFEEETGFAQLASLPERAFMPLGSIRQIGGKVVTAWAVEFDVDASKVISNLCEIEWPPRTGRRIQVPEVDRAAWFEMLEARSRIFAAQQPFLDRLADTLAGRS